MHIPHTQPSFLAGVRHFCLSLLINISLFSGALSQTTTLFTTQTPSGPTNNDHQPAVGQEVGVKFKSSVAGYIIGIRFYNASNLGTHIGELYSANGVRLAQAYFTDEAGFGWETVSFPKPVAITANTTYVAAFFSSLGNYTEDNNYFLNHSLTNGSLTAIADGTNGASGNDPGNGQGLFKYTSSPAFPNQLYKSANYWVDPIFSIRASAPPVANAGPNQILDRSDAIVLDGTGSTGNIISYKWTQISGPFNGTLFTPNQAKTGVVEFFRGTGVFELSVNGGASTSQVTITVNPPLPIANAGPDQTITSPASTVTLDASGSSGIFDGYFWGQIAGPNTATFSSTADVKPVVSGLIPGTYRFRLTLGAIFGSAEVKVTVLPPIDNLFTTNIPIAGTDNDHKSTIGHEVGVKFSSSVAGLITGVRFYKTTGNTGTHTGELYSSTGTRLAQAIFTNETASGWQQVLFTTPVTISANTTYTAAYFSSLGNYTEDNDYFLHHSITNPPLTAPADGTNGGSGTDPGNGQGVYKYTSSPAFPNQLYRSANYWVDPIFSPASTSPVPNAGPDQTIAFPTTSVTLNGTGSTGPITGYAWQVVSGPVTGLLNIASPNSATTTVTNLAIGQTRFRLTLNGNALLNSEVKINVIPPVSPGTLFTTQTPQASTDNDRQVTTGQEVGVKFRTSVAGFISGITFYKTAGNFGTHIGELYSASGENIISVPFTNETSSGWQVVYFNSPLEVQANTTYTAAYFSSLGNYTEDNDYFLHHAVINGSLVAPEDGTNGANGTDPGTGQGVYKYTPVPTFPNQLYRSANYWVDVIFSPKPGQANLSAGAEKAKAVDTDSNSTEKLTWWLGQNHPNPVAMSQITKIEYSVPVAAKIELVLYDMQGRQVKMMVSEQKNAGRYAYELNTASLAKGLYLYSLHSGSFHAVKKLVVQ